MDQACCHGTWQGRHAHKDESDRNVDDKEDKFHNGNDDATRQGNHKKNYDKDISIYPYINFDY